MGNVFKILTSSALLLLCVILAIQPAYAQKRYPSIEDAWDATDYRALVERVERDGLALPTLSDAATKPVFDRMVNDDNIPLRVGLNPELSVTIRFQRLDGALDPIHKLVALYLNEMQKGKPYASELARLMVYETKISGAILDITEPMLSSLEKSDKYYEARVAEINKMKGGARQIFSGLVQSMTETQLYSKPNMLKMSSGALDELQSYQPILSDQDRQDLAQKLTQQISKTTDQELKTALTQLRDAVKDAGYKGKPKPRPNTARKSGDPHAGQNGRNDKDI